MSVEWFNGSEKNIIGFIVLYDFGKVVAKSSNSRSKVVRSITAAGSTTALCHPPGRRIGECLEDKIFSLSSNLKENVALTGVGTPVVWTVFSGLETGNGCTSVTFGQMIMPRSVTSSDVIPKDIVTQSGIWIDYCTNQSGSVRRTPASSIVCPPAKTASPSLKTLIFY